MQSADKICEVSGCGKRAKAKDLCPSHYNAWLRKNNRPCQIDGCENSVAAQDLCSMHWQRLRRNGSPTTLRQKPYEAENRVLSFWMRVAITADDEKCWIWLPSRKTGQYGAFSLDGTTRGAHVVSWMLANGREPRLFVLHRCDNPRCVNPKHLYEGTQSQNMRDRWARTGR